MVTKSALYLREHRKKMIGLGFKTVGVQLPKEVIDFADDFKRINGFSSRGHAITAILLEYINNQSTEEQATK